MRPFLAALHSVFRGADPPREASRFVPLAGIFVGVGAAAIYWLSAQLWPTSIAVAIAMLATAFLSDAPPTASLSVLGAFFLLIKYNALMALSSAAAPFALPEYLPLGLVMIAGQASSRALALPARINIADHAIALLIGGAPGALLGIPGLIGIAAALAARLGLSLLAPPRLMVQQITEVCFYLAALAAWKYV